MKSFLFVSLITTFLATTLISCGGESSNDKKRVVIYSPHGVEILRPVEKDFELAHPTIDLVFYDLPTATCVTRLRAEKEKPQADIWWGGPVGEFISAERAGLLDSYTPSWIEHTDNTHYSKNKTWFCDWQTPEIIMYNNKRLSAEEAPQDWDDVLDPKWQGRLCIRDPLQSGTMKTIYGAMVLRAPSVDEGFAWLRKLDRQNLGVYAGKPAIMYEQLKRGAKDITLWNMADAYIQSEQNNYPFSFIIPKSGSPIVLEGIAIVKDAPHRKEAEAFLEFVTSPQRLAKHAHDFHRIPVIRKDLERSTLPTWMTEQEIKAIPIDWESFAGQSSEWMSRWKREIRGSGSR